jgi:hypothetical protein
MTDPTSLPPAQAGQAAPHPDGTVDVALRQRMAQQVAAQADDLASQQAGERKLGYVVARHHIFVAHSSIVRLKLMPSLVGLFRDTPHDEALHEALVARLADLGAAPKPAPATKEYARLDAEWRAFLRTLALSVGAQGVSNGADARKTWEQAPGTKARRGGRPAPGKHRRGRAPRSRLHG